MKRKMTEYNKIKALEYVNEKIDYGDNLKIIYVSKDNTIIVYEDLSNESITICSRNFKHVKELYPRDLEDCFLLFYLIEFLQNYYIVEYVKEIVKDFLNTDLEEYEEIMKF